jgi:hypothetical protein
MPDTAVPTPRDMLAAVDARLAAVRAQQEASPLGRLRQRTPLVDYTAGVADARAVLCGGDAPAARALTAALRAAVSGYPRRVAEHLASLTAEQRAAVVDAAALIAKTGRTEETP